MKFAARANTAEEHASKNAAAKRAKHLQDLPTSRKYGYTYEAAQLPSGKWGIISHDPGKQDVWYQASI